MGLMSTPRPESVMDPTNSVAGPSSVTKEHRGNGGAAEPQANPNPKRPLKFLELSRDILELILDEITYTNDLTALALTHSSLYYLAVPRIYARFDIVWPDGNATSSEKKTVDALTYGLSTLTLGSRFASVTRKIFRSGDPASPVKFGESSNNYARYVKRFSLGDGPPDWAADYKLGKEGGKMLGTLVAQAVAKMRNLETFVWDTPTGVSSDVFLALASLGDQPDGECKLNSVRVRWHIGVQDPEDPPAMNVLIGTLRPHVPQGFRLTPIGIVLPDRATHPPPREPFASYADYYCEYPTFSVLPPLRSLTGLDIDYVSYLDEMAILIERSKHVLKELSVGIAIRATARDFAHAWDGPDLKQSDLDARWPGASTIGLRRLGGVLGIIFSRIYDIRKHEDSIAQGKPSGTLVPRLDDQVQFPSLGKAPPARYTYRPLGLDVLELERVSLSTHVLRYVIDWTILTSLTLLDCPQHELLWRMLKKEFRPTPTAGGRHQYHLALTKIHTDLTCVSLIEFIRDALTPHTLEVLFLQDRRSSTGAIPPPIPIGVIWNMLFRQSLSLKMLLLDSSSRNQEVGRWRAWCPSTEMVYWLTSGTLPNLTQLSMSLRASDWHQFIRRLPNMPRLLALHIPRVADYPTGNYAPGELTQQIADVITLRPEIRRLCYVGIATKCFEFLENRPPARFGHRPRKRPYSSIADDTHMSGVDDEEDGNPDDGDEGEDDANEGDQDGSTPTTTTNNDEEEESDDSDDDWRKDRLSTDPDWFDEALSGPKLKLREILFYDDKIAIFKARHGRL